MKVAAVIIAVLTFFSALAAAMVGNVLPLILCASLLVASFVGLFVREVA